MAAPLRTLVTLPPKVRRGEPFELRVLAAHAMETGHRRDADGRLLPRDILTRLSVFQGERLLVQVELHPAIAANPFLQLPLVLNASGPLRLVWRGDGGLTHEELREIVVE
jgi:sulfur-oxidizing protein SoxZ